MKILIVDDNKENLYLLETLLQANGYEIASAETGVEALKKLSEDRFDIVISDILMPEMDGFQLCRAIKTSDKLKQIAFVFYTATYLDAKDAEFALSLGAERFIVKPTDPGEFIKILKEVIHQRDFGTLAAPKPPIEDETVYLKLYNERLIQKLEDKLLQLEQAKTLILDNQNLLKAIIDSEPECVKLLSADGNLIDMNPAGLRMIEADSLEKVAGKCIYPLVASQHREAFTALTKSVFEGETGRLEVEIVGLKGTHRWLEINAVPLRNDKGQIISLLSVTRDITQRKQLLEVSNVIISTLELEKLYLEIRPSFCRMMPTNFIGLTLYDAENKQIRLKFIDFPGNQDLYQDRILAIGENSTLDAVFKSMKPVFVNSINFENFSLEFSQIFRKERIKSVCCLPLIPRGRFVGILIAASRQPAVFTPEIIDFLYQVTNQIAIAIDNALAYRQIIDLKNKLSEEKLYLEQEITSELSFGEIIGKSAVIKDVLRQVEIVSPTDSSVLILGETGTGKELIARAIHRLSRRQKHNFVKINCGAVPTGLLESELFGHEKGAFTGAVTQRIGRFELAHQGTIFLDEVGDIPMELQTKLLRVLQEHEFERLGSSKTIQVNVRLIAATNRDLEQMVVDKQFRSDLYYRLKVFPILVPPLRERSEDIPLLVRQFSEKYAQRMNKRITTIPGKTMAALLRYQWPGNIRELENLMERAVILSPASALQVPIAELRLSKKIPGGKSITTLEEAERDLILVALDATNWVVAGPKGAAARLGMNRSTLRARMRKLGVSR
jgi:formate hydrogenlyase transcriptional activator